MAGLGQWLKPVIVFYEGGLERSNRKLERTGGSRAAGRHNTRPVYRFSVIRGGAYNAGELIRAQRADPVVGLHYRGFQADRIRTVASNFEKPVYVSYRKGDSVFWTRKPVQLPTGERLLTDGSLYARARCGNRISEVPQEPVADSEPATALLDATQEDDVEPATALLDAAKSDDEADPVAALLAAAVSEDAAEIPEPFYRRVESAMPQLPFGMLSDDMAPAALEWSRVPLSAGSALSGRSPAPFSFMPVPEPGSVILFSLGVAALGGIRLWTRRSWRQ